MLQLQLFKRRLRMDRASNSSLHKQQSCEASNIKSDKAKDIIYFEGYIGLSQSGKKNSPKKSSIAIQNAHLKSASLYNTTAIITNIQQLMEEKAKLVLSMQKLISHILISRSNQEEIFNSLSRHDLRKMIANLQDENQNLRKVSLLLICKLLHNNSTTKQKFCSIMSIPLVAGRVCLSTKLCSSRGNKGQDLSKNVSEVFALLKQSISEDEERSLFWFINYQNPKQAILQLQYVNKFDPKSLNFSELVDPIDCMIGFILHERGHNSQYVQQLRVAARDKKTKKSEQIGQGHNVNKNYFKATNKPKQKQAQTKNQVEQYQPGYCTDRDNIGKAAKTKNMILDQTSFFMKKDTLNLTQPISNQELHSAQKQMKIVIPSSKNKDLKMLEGPALLTPLNTYKSPKISVANKTTSGQRNRGYETMREKKPGQKYAL